MVKCLRCNSRLIDVFDNLDKEEKVDFLAIRPYTDEIERKYNLFECENCGYCELRRTKPKKV